MPQRTPREALQQSQNETGGRSIIRTFDPEVPVTSFGG